MKSVSIALGLALGLALPLAPSIAYAAGAHGGGHEDMHAAMALGQPAEPAKMRTVKIAMKETDDGRMIFTPSKLAFGSGETVRLLITNEGESEHEFVMDTPEEIQEHKDMMAEMPEMAHEEANAVRLQPGEEGEIFWTFGEKGEYEYACLLLGHYEAGMHGPLKVY